MASAVVLTHSPVPEARRERQQRWPPLACESLILGLWLLETLAPLSPGCFCFGSLTSAPPLSPHWSCLISGRARGESRVLSRRENVRMHGVWGWGGGRGNKSSCGALLGLSFPNYVTFHRDWSRGGADPSQTTTQSKQKQSLRLGDSQLGVGVQSEMSRRRRGGPQTPCPLVHPQE